MERFFIKRAKQLLKKKEHRKKQQIFVTCLAVFVITGTAYAMIKPAITMQKSNQELDCPYESGTVAHEHNKYCYDNDGELICQLEEIEPHTHTEDCYTQKEVLICDIEEGEGHIHTDECYELERGALLCEDEEHEHTDECYEWNSVLICDKEETEGHIHTDDCYKTVSILECGKEELPVHEHNKSCFVTVSDEENIDNEADSETDEETAVIGQEYDEELYDEALYDDYLEDDYGIEVMSSGEEIQDELVETAANDWQIVSGGYEGNDVSNKTPSDDESVMLQKNVIPTDTENEFLVYLSIDTKDMFTEYFKYATYKGTQSNSNHDKALGSIVSSVGGNKGVNVSGEQLSGYGNSTNITIKSSNGDIIAENVAFYWDTSNNFTLFLELSSNKYVILGTSIKKGGNDKDVMLSAEAEAEIRKAVSDFSLVSVEDEMGDNIEFLGVVGGDYDSEPTFSKNILTWEPRTNDSATVDESKENGYTTRWYRNVSQLLYKVRLKTEEDGFNSCAVNLDDYDGNDGDFSYKVNNYATLTYDSNKTVDFPIPAVQGLLYDVQVKKVDSGDGTALAGAEFKVSSTGSSKNSKYYSTNGITGKNGLLTLTVPFGSYTLTETKPPSGYMDNENSSDFTVCYTDNKDNLEINGNNMLYISDDNDYITVENDKIPNLYLIKVNDSGTPLGGAEFELYKADDNWNEGDYVGTATSSGGLGSLGEFSFEGLELGNYLLYETVAPNGYYKADEPWKIVVAKSGISITDFNGAPVSNTDEEGNIEIVNSSGAVLPSTGGNGTGSYAVVGLTLMAISLYIYRKKYLSEEGNLTNGIHK